MHTSGALSEVEEAALRDRNSDDTEVRDHIKRDPGALPWGSLLVGGDS